VVVLVIGATGKVGQRVVAGLLERGVVVRALLRGPDSAAMPPQVELVAGDLSRPAEFAERVSNSDSVFLVWPFLSADGAEQVVQAIRGGRTRHVVYLSAEAASRRPDSFWAAVEHAVEGSFDHWTFLRPTGFAANTLMWADQIRRGDVVRWVYGQAARSLIDERDIADVGVRALTEPGHTGERYVLTGPETITQIEQVRAIGAALGRELRWEEIQPEQLGDELTRIPSSALETWASFVRHPEIVTQTVREITGRPARPFEQWALDHADQFR
jgi:uncharacterized protein YbjT (DUF2867 family)